MNWQEFQESREFYRNYREPSRADFALGALVLAFFAALLGTNLNTTPDLGSMIIRAIVGLALAVGAVICLIHAMRNESDEAVLKAQPVKARTQHHSLMPSHGRR